MIWWPFLTIPIVFITFILTGVFKKKNTDQKQSLEPPTDGQKNNHNIELRYG